MPTHPLDFVTVIQATLAPMFLITGAGIYLNFIQSRLFRAVDRIRTLDDEIWELRNPTDDDAGEGGGTGPGRTRDEGEILRETRFQLDRIRSLRTAVALGSMTMAFTALAGALILLGVFFARDIGFPVIATFTVALFCLVLSLGYGMRDTYNSMRSVERGLWAEAAGDGEN